MSFANTADGEPWMEDGLCRTHPEPDLWYSEKKADRDEAREVCAVCPVRLECLEFAITGRGRGITADSPRQGREQYGIWGGVNFELPGRPAKYWKDIRAQVKGLPRT